MKRTFLKLGSVLALTLLSQSSKADTLVGPGGAFQPWTAAVLGPANNPTYTSATNPGPYWNNFSGDGPTANIGWCMVGSGGCVIASPPGAISYYGNGYNAVSNMYFQSNGTAITVSLIGQLTNQVGTGGNSGYNVFGWYQVDPTTGAVLSMTSLWNSKSDTVGQSATFTPSGTYGLFLENVQGNGAADYFWFMNSSQNHSVGPDANPVDASQHFAVFSGTSGVFYVGIDDTNNGNQDYNNMIIELVNAPEPRTFVLLAFALLVLGFGFVRRGPVASNQLSAEGLTK